MILTRGVYRVGFININNMYNNDVGMGWYRVMKLMEFKLRGLLLRRKKIFFYIYDVITSPENTVYTHADFNTG